MKPETRVCLPAVSRLRGKGVPLVNVWGIGWLLPDEAIERHVAHRDPASTWIAMETEIPSAA